MSTYNQQMEWWMRYGKETEGKLKKRTVKLNEFNRASLSPQFSMTKVSTPNPWGRGLGGGGQGV